MSTLFLSAPKTKSQQGSNFYKDFFTILARGVGPDYGISATLIAQVFTGTTVVVFDRDRRLRAEGVVTNYAPTSKAGNGVQRYDISIRNLAKVPYIDPPRVNRFGVAIT